MSQPTERTGLVTIHGNPLTLQGTPVKVGDKAPDFTLLTNDLAPATLADYKGKALVLSAVPSLDTPVCSTETKKWEASRADLGDIAMMQRFPAHGWARHPLCARH